MEIDREDKTKVVERAGDALKRWDARRGVREKRQSALNKGNPLAADTPERLTLRTNRLIDDVRRACRKGRVPASPILRELVSRPEPVTPAELNEEILEEVVIGARNFLSIEFFERGLLAARSVGCVVIERNGVFRARGTGFLVAPGVMITNEHVLTSRELAANCALQLDYEQNLLGPTKTPQVFRLRPEALFINDEPLDFALVAVSEASDQGARLSDYGWLPLNKAQGKISISDKDYVNIIQHPEGREKEVVVRDNRVLDMRTGNETAAKSLGGFLHYETDTQKGSSGSPVCNDGWEVVALHHSGVPKTDDQGRWLNTDGKLWNKDDQSVDDIAWQANEAVRVSSIIAAASIAPIGEHERPLLDGVLDAVPPTMPERLDIAEERVPDAKPRQRPAVRHKEPPVGAERAATGVVTLEIPLRISVSLGDGQASGVARTDPVAPARPVQGDDSILVEAFDPEDFASRDGFDRNFLRTEVPLPQVKAQPRFGGVLQVTRPARPEDKSELRYHHYSVVMNAERRLAYFSACNLDFDAPQTASRDEGRNSWLNDPRIKNKEQLGARFYTNNDYDRGHLTRRDDTAWGETKAAAIEANDDTFFFPNAAPQHFLLNQSDEFTHANLKLWGDLENHISDQGLAQRTRLSVLNGPIFGNNDKPLRGALVPLSFFKIVIWHDEDAEEPGAVGFVLEQADLVAGLPEEAIDPGEFSIRQRRISDIEASVDLSFGQVSNWDRLPAVAPEESLDDGIEILSIRDVRL